MNRPDSGHFTLLPEHRDRPVGFAHVVLDADPTWGALIDNLHVVRSVQRRGVGTLLLVSCSADRHGTAAGVWDLALGPLDESGGARLIPSRRVTLCDPALAAPPRGALVTPDA